MKLKPGIHVSSFLQAVRTCSGKVHFITSEGDDLDLKSTLSQFVFAAVVADKLQHIDGRIMISEPQDAILLQDYCISEH